MKNGLKPIPRLIVSSLLGISVFLAVALAGFLVELTGKMLFGWHEGMVFGMSTLPAAFAGGVVGLRAYEDLPGGKTQNHPKHSPSGRTD